MDLLGGKTDLSPDHLETISAQLFEVWGPVAAEIFRNNTSATFHNDSDDSRAEWDKYLGTGVAEADEKTDVKAALSGKKNPDKYFYGKKSNDCVLTSGLSYATNLDAVVTHMCQDVAEGLGERYNTESGTIYSKIDLKSVKDKKETKAYYRLVTSIDNNGETYGYYYNSYALVLYDFELAPIVASGVTVTNAVEKEDNTGTIGNKSSNAKSYFENRSQSASTVSSNFSYSTSESVVNSTPKPSDLQRRSEPNRRSVPFSELPISNRNSACLCPPTRQSRRPSESRRRSPIRIPIQRRLPCPFRRIRRSACWRTAGRPALRLPMTARWRSAIRLRYSAFPASGMTTVQRRRTG